MILPSDRHSEDRPNLVTIAHFSRRAARSVQPLREIHQLDLVLDANVHNENLHDVQTLGDSGNPLIAADCCEPERNSLVQRRCRDFDCVRHAVHVLNRHATRQGFDNEHISLRVKIGRTTATA